MTVPRLPDPPVTKAASRLWFRRWNAMCRLLGMCRPGVPFALAYTIVLRRSPVSAAGEAFRTELGAAWRARKALLAKVDTHIGAGRTGCMGPVLPSHPVRPAGQDGTHEKEN